MSLFHCRSGFATLQGRRPSNQDAGLDLRLPDGKHLVAVADGMGGHRSGEVASSLALEALRREVENGRPLREAVIAANEAVFTASTQDPSCAGMGTTLVALLRSQAAYEIANVGDSRAYRIDRQGIRQITTDHSFAAEAARNALMSEEEIARSPWRNALTRSLGTSATVDVDCFGPYEILGEPHAVMLCSDGLYRVVGEDSIWQSLIAADDPQEAARRLSDLAIWNRSDDNISVAVVEFESGWKPGPRKTEEPVASVSPQWSGTRDTAVATAPHAVAARAERALPLTRTSRTRPSWLRRYLSVALSDTVLFGLCTAILVTWLALRLING